MTPKYSVGALSALFLVRRRKALCLFSICGALVLLVAALPMSGAKAATITRTYDFAASGFPSGSPVDPWQGSFTITYDPTAIGDFTGSLDAFSSNLPPSYSPFAYGQHNNLIGIGDSCDAFGCSVSSTANQAVVVFDVDAFGNPLTGFEGAIASTSTTLIFFSTDLSVTLSAATPLPAALPLFVTGLGALGLLGWRRKKKAAMLAA